MENTHGRSPLGLVFRGMVAPAWAAAFCVLAALLFPAKAQAFNPKDSTTFWFGRVEEAFYDRNFSKCFEYLSKLKTHNKSNPVDSVQAEIDDWEGCLYTELGYFPKAEALFKKSISIHERIGDLQGVAVVLMDLDYMISRRDRPENADWQYILRAVELLEQLHDTTQLILCYDNLGYTYFSIGNMEKALEFGHKSEALWETRKEDAMHPNPLDNLGEYYLKLGKLDRAEYYLRKCIRLCEEYPGKASETAKHEAHLYLGEVCIRTGRRAEGIGYLQKALEYAHRRNDGSIAQQASRALVEEAMSRKDYQTAVRLQQEYIDYADSLHKEETFERLANSQVLWRINQREQDFEKLQRAYEKQRADNSLNGLVLYLLFIVCVAIFFLYHQNRRFNADLKTEVARQTEALRRSNEELERFAYIASHDLRTPLRNVISFVSLIERRLKNNLDPDVQEYIRFARDYAHTMNRIIDDVLAYSKIGRSSAAAATQANVNMVELVHRVVQALDEPIKLRGGSVETLLPLPAVRAEETQIMQLLQNLIENGLKYNQSAAPRVEVGFDTSLPVPAFFVRDNGIGIEPQYAQKVFEMFARLHTVDQYPGTGLGLAICKKIVEQNDGRIWLESTEGQGTTIFFTLPLADKTDEKTPDANLRERVEGHSLTLN